MAEYISKNRIYDLINAVNSVNGFTSYEDYVGLLKDVEASTNADVRPVDRWISCKDKMPDDYVNVLFCYISENGVKSVHYGYHQTIKGLGTSWVKPSGGLQYCDDDVAYWQPIPESPEPTKG